VVPLLTLYLGQHYTVNVPKWDDWVIVGKPLLNYTNGTLDSGDLFDQVVDNRMPVPRTVFLALAVATAWNAHANTLATWLFALMAVAAVATLAHQTWPQQAVKSTLTMLVASALLFTPTAWMVWTFSPFMANTLMLSCILWAVVGANHTAKCASVPFATAIALASLASWTYLSGWLTWALLAWVVLGWWINGQATLRHALTTIAVMGSIATVWLLLYLQGYQSQAKPDTVGLFLANPLRFLVFFLHWLGAPFGDILSLSKDATRLSWDRSVAAVAGGLGLAAMIGLIPGILRDVDQRRRAWPWIGIALWALAAGGLVTIGRIELSEDAAFWPRYQLFSVLFWIALAVFALLLPWPPGRLAGAGIVATATALLTGWLMGIPGTLEDMRGDFLSSLNVRAGIEMMEVAPTALPLYRSFPGDLGLVHLLANTLTDKGFIKPGILKEKKVSAANLEGHPDRYKGTLESAELAANGTLIAKGWAFDSVANRPVDAVVVSCQPPGGKEQWFGIACKFSDGKKRAAKLGLRGRFARINWTYMELPPGLPRERTDVAPAPLVPRGKSTIRAYALDTDKLAFTRLDGEVILDVQR
jgi:hypothetical protein